MATHKLTDYEQKRLENIRRNSEMMAALKIHATASQLSVATKRQRDGSSKSYKVSPEKKPKTKTPIVIRRSLRARGIPPDSKGLDGDFIEPSNASLKSSIPENHSPRVLGPISMRDAYSGTGSDRALIDAILSIEKRPQVDFSIKREFDGDRVVKEEPTDSKVVKNELIEGVSCDLVKGKVKSEYFDCKVEVEKKEFESCLDLESMSLKPENIARIVPGRIMVVRVLPSDHIRMVVAGNKFGDIGFWNVDSEGKEGDGIYLYRPNNGPISGILFQQSCFSKIFTSCYDGFLRLMDAEKEVFNLAYSSDDTIFSLSQRPNDVKNLYFGEGRGGLSMFDERVGSVSSRWTLHEDRINSIDFNSQNTHIMATSSTDGIVCLWDIRSLNAGRPRDLKTVNHKRAVHSAYFSPSGISLATTSADDTVGILSGVDFEDTSMIYHNNRTGRWISSFKAIWGWDDSYVFIGNMKRGVDVISPAQRRVVTTLQSPHISAIPCRFDKHPLNVGMLAGATSGGQVYIWNLS